MILNNLNVSTIINDSKLGVGGGKIRRTGNHGTSANRSSHAELSWRLKELTKGVVTTGVGSLFQYFTSLIEKEDFL